VGPARQLVGLVALERVLRFLGRDFGGARLHVAPEVLAIPAIGGAVALALVVELIALR